MLGIFSAMEISASGLSAERVRMNTIASNLANAKTTRTEEGGPYRRLDPVFVARPLGQARFSAGTDASASVVHVDRIVEDQRPGMMVHQPGHPDADEAGYVEYPNVNVVEEMVNMITASRAYEAGVSSVSAVKRMARSAIDIGG